MSALMTLTQCQPSAILADLYRLDLEQRRVGEVEDPRSGGQVRGHDLTLGSVPNEDEVAQRRHEPQIGGPCGVCGALVMPDSFQGPQ